MTRLRTACFSGRNSIASLADTSQAERTAACPEEIDHADVLIITHGHFTRCFIPRWCNLPLQAGYNFAADPGGVAVLGYQHMTLKEPCESSVGRRSCG